MALTLIECTDKECWDRFNEESPHGSVFCRTAFLDALAEEYRLLLVQDRGVPRAGIVLILRAGQPYPGQYPLTMYQGLLLGRDLCLQPAYKRSPLTLEVLDFLLTELTERYDRLVVCQHHRFEDLRGFSLFHAHEPDQGQFRIDLHYSGLLDLARLADFDHYLASIRTVRRQEYRRCQAKGFYVRPSHDLEMLDQLHARTFARQGIDREPNVVRVLRAVSEASLAKGFGALLTCTAPDGTVASATLFLFDRSCAYYWIGANHPAYRHTGSGPYLLIENMRHFQQKGLKAVDFVGINSPNRGDFKTSFNAMPVPYFVASWERPAPSPSFFGDASDRPVIVTESLGQGNGNGRPFGLLSPRKPGEPGTLAPGGSSPSPGMNASGSLGS
jgi:GNAT superfamily N-acetyltransferase